MIQRGTVVVVTTTLVVATSFVPLPPPQPAIGWQSQTQSVISNRKILAGKPPPGAGLPQSDNVAGVAGTYENFDYRFVPSFSAAQQQYSSFQPQGYIGLSFPEGWEEPLNYAFSSPLAAAHQQYYAFQPQGKIVSSFPDGWRGWAQLEYAFARPINAALHEFFAQLPQGPPVPINASASFDAIVIFPRLINDYFAFRSDGYPAVANTPAGSGGFEENFDYRFTPPFPAALQPDKSDFQPQGKIVSSFPDGWRGLQYEVRFTPPVLLGETWFPLYKLITQLNNVTGTGGLVPFFHAYSFAPAFPVGSQQFSSLGMVPEASVEPLPPPGPGGGKRKQKPGAQPIWDRKEPAPAAEPAAVAEPAPKIDLGKPKARPFADPFSGPMRAPIVRDPVAEAAEAAAAARKADDAIAIKLLMDSIRQDRETLAAALREILEGEG